MDNIISIYTRKQPCDYLHVTEEQFKKFFDQNWFGTHVWNCEDCIKRYSNANRYLLAELIQQEQVLEEKNDVSE